MSKQFLFPEGGYPATAIAPESVGPVAGVGEFITKAGKAQSKSAARPVMQHHAASLVPAQSSGSFHNAQQPRRSFLDSSGKMKVVRDHSLGVDDNAIFIGAATRHEAAYATDDRYDTSGDPLSGSGTNQESRERVAVMQKVRWAFENDGVVETVELAKRRYCEPLKWRAKYGDKSEKTRLNNFIANEMTAERFDWAQEDDLPTVIKSAVIDWGLDGDTFGNMISPNGEDTFYTQMIRGHRVGKDAAAHLDITAEMNDFLELRGPNKRRFREVGGIVLDSRNRRRAIRAYDEKEEDLNDPFRLGLNRNRGVKTIQWGQILQVIDKRHSDRVREFSRWNTSIDPVIDLKQTWDYLQITLKAQAGMPFLQTNKAPQAGSYPIDPKTGRPTLVRNPNANRGADADQPVEIVPGKIQTMPHGAELVDFVAKRPNAQFKDCVRFLLHKSAYTAEIPYPFLYDSSGTNGGALRLENDKAAGAFHSIQRVLKKTFLEKWVRAKIKQGIETGHELLRGFEMKDLTSLSEGEWSFPPLPTADEKYRSSATIAAWQAGHCSTDDVVGPQGKSADEVLAEKDLELRNKAETARATARDYPEMPFMMAMDHLGMVGPNGNVPYMAAAGGGNESNSAAEKGGSQSASANGAGASNPSHVTSRDVNNLALLEMQERMTEFEHRFESVSEQMEQLEMFDQESVSGESPASQSRGSKSKKGNLDDSV